MTHSIIYNSEMRIIETKIQGNVTLKDMKAIFSDALQMGIEKETFLFLSDFQDATFKLSTLEIFDLPKILSSTAIPLGLSTYQFKRAIVTARGFTDSRFAENVNANQGHNAKFFYDADEARKWLVEA